MMIHRFPAFTFFFVSLCFSPITSLLSLSQDRPTPGHQYSVDSSFPQGDFDYPKEAVSAVATDSDGNLFVFHRSRAPIMKWNPAGRLLRAFGDGLFQSAHGLRIAQDDTIWLTDSANHTVLKMDREGNVLLSLGVRDQPGDDSEHFNRPTDVAFSRNGDFYVSDGYGNARVVKFDRNGKYLLAWGKKGSQPGEFHLPHAIQVDAQERVYVGDRENDRIQIFDSNGNYLDQIRGIAPFGLFITPEQHMFIADGRANRVVKMTLQGKVLAEWGKTGESLGEFQMPHGITVGKDGAVYVTEITGKRVQKFVPQTEDKGSTIGKQRK